MAIKFENLDTKETLSIDPKTEGKFYGAKLSAAINSSNMSINADRGQDKGWRLDVEQQALIEMWEQDGEMIDRVSTYTKVPVSDLSHADFLQYLVYQQSIGTSPEKREIAIRRERQQDYDARVEALRNAKTAEPMAPFVAPTLESFMDGTLTGDASGDKVEEAAPLPPPVVAQPKVLEAPAKPSKAKK